MNFSKILDFDEIGRVAGTQEADVQFVVQYRVDAGGAQHCEHRLAALYGSHDELIDVPDNQIIGMLVVTAQHAHFRMLADQPIQRFEIFRCRTFAN